MSVEMHVLDLLPAYALGCLEKDESAIVDKHLQICGLCRAELQRYQEVSACLALVAPQIPPPAGVKAVLMRRVESTQRARPTVKSSAPWWRVFNAGPRLSFTWGLVGLVLVLVLLASNLWLWQQVNQLRSTVQQEQFQVVNLLGTDFSPQATGVIIISLNGMHGTLVVDDLPPLSEEHQYQLWLIRNGQRTSGAIFSVGQSGYGATYIASPEPLNSYSSFGITIEPTGGSPGPTGEKVLGGDL